MVAYLSMQEQCALIRERQRQPIEFAGETWYITTDAAERRGLCVETLRVSARHIPGNNVILTTASGARFVRVPRHRNDLKAPIYWNLDSLR